MYNLCLPMRVINITQHSGSSFSHPNCCLDLAGVDSGIDFAFALGYWKCVAFPWGYNTAFFVSCNESGVPVQVHCADGKNRVVTVAMTHANFQYVDRPYVGQIYAPGEVMYEEGTYGQATGNHIHYEVAEGLQTKKYKDERLGVYRMNGELKPEDVCYICDSFSTVASMGGAVMSHCASEYYVAPDTKTFKPGYQEIAYQDQKILVYKQREGEKITVVSCPYGKAIDIRDFSIPGKRIKCAVNANYFMMGSGDGYLGRVQGLLNGTKDVIDARPPSPAEKGLTEDKPFMDLILTKQGGLSFGDFNSWDYPIQDVVFGTSPAGVEIANAQPVNKYSPEVGYNKIVTRNTQTMLMRCVDGKFALGVVPDELAPIPGLQAFGLEYGLDHLSCYDSGGSSQMIVEGKKKLYTGRKIPVVFIIYEDENTPDIVPENAIGTIHCEKTGMNVRDSVRGEVLVTIKKHDTCEILSFIEGIQADGYQWVLVRYNGVVGYAQLDTAVVWIGMEGEKV